MIFTLKGYLQSISNELNGMECITAIASDWYSIKIFYASAFLLFLNNSEEM